MVFNSHFCVQPPTTVKVRMSLSWGCVNRNTHPPDTSIIFSLINAFDGIPLEFFLGAGPAALVKKGLSKIHSLPSDTF